jgi:hypothetical protein
VNTRQKHETLSKKAKMAGGVAQMAEHRPLVQTTVLQNNNNNNNNKIHFRN